MLLLKVCAMQNRFYLFFAVCAMLLLACGVSTVEARSHFLPNYQTGGFSFDNSEDISVACPTSTFAYTKDNCTYPNTPQYSCGGRYRVCGCDRDFAYSAAQCEAMGKVGGDQSCTVRGGSDSGTVYYTTCKCPSSYPKLTTGQKCVGGTECSYAGEKYCDSTSHIQCESNYKVCDQNKSGRSGSCTAGGVTKYIDCYCDENLYPQTNETCKADFGANAVVSGEICGNNERGKSCSCEPNALPDGYSESCGSQGYSASIDDGCGGTYYKCNDAGCGDSNYCGYLCVKDSRPKQTLYENINSGLIGDNTCVNSFFAYDSRDFNGNTITLKNITTHLKVNRPDSGSFWPYSKRAYLALIYGDTVYLEGTHNLTLEGAVDFAACGTGCNIRSQSGATINLNGTCYKLPAGYHYQCSGNCFEKTPPNAGTCDGTCPIPQESGATTVTTCSQLTSAVAAGTRTIIVGGSFTCTQGISLNANQSLVGSGYFSGSASKPTITFNLSSATAGISAGNCSTIANLGIKYSSSATAQYVGALTVKGKEDVQIKNVDITSSISASTVVLTGALDISGSSSVTVSEKLSISNSGKYAGGIKTSASKLEIASATVTATTNGTGAYGLATDNGGTLTISGNSDVSVKTTGTGASYSSPTANTANVVLRYSNAQVNIKDSARLTLSASGGNTFLIEGAGSSSSQSVKLTETASLSLVKGSASNIYAINRSRINMGSQTSITSSAQNTIYGSYFTAAAGASYTSGSSKSVCSSAISSKYVNSVTTPF